MQFSPMVPPMLRWRHNSPPPLPSFGSSELSQKAASFPPDFSTAAAAPLLGNGSRVTAPDTVPFCVWAAARFGGESWEEALWQTVSALGDRDTTCAIVGGILALAKGYDAIPQAWLQARESLP